MENKIRIAEMQIGQAVQGFYLVNDIRIRVSSAGSPYFSARISDNTGVMDAKVWNYSGPISESDSGKVVLVQGEVTEFNRTHQLKIERIRLATEEDNYNLEDLIPVAPIDRQDALSEVFEIIGSMEDDDYRVFCQTMLNRHHSAFQSLPAAKSVHHAFLSGLLMHTLNMLRAANFLAGLYSEVISRDLLLAGTLLHDFGKEKEFLCSELGLVTDYSVPGKLLGHLYMGAVEVAELANELKMPEEKSMLLQHMILSHHGKPEYGATVEPQCAESELLSIIDLMDSRMEIYAETLAVTQPGSFSGKNFGLGKAVYRHK